MSLLSLTQTYAAIFGVIAASAFTLPPGQEVAVLAAGRLVAHGGLQWWPVFLVAVPAVVTADAVIFLLARRACIPLVARINRPRAVALAQWMAGAGDGAIVIARFVPGTRLLMFVCAGARGIHTRRFVALDTCAAIVWVPSMLRAGAWLLNVHLLTRIAAWAFPH